MARLVSDGGFSASQDFLRRYATDSSDEIQGESYSGFWQETLPINLTLALYKHRPEMAQQDTPTEILEKIKEEESPNSQDARFNWRWEGEWTS